ncbi:Ger(x)C family spore germination protein [Niallia sp. Krafla_26]|uniref:Ger(x)C family spore germination protein n=1 Tax=Niallia sp. Krafla_26 TaxID=3064703 RepID=UPI003D164EE8
MRKKTLFLNMFLCLFLTGCWDQRELSNLSVVTGMAIDIGKNAPYVLTIEAINAAELNEQTTVGNAPTIIFSLEGKTIGELSHKMNVGVSRNLIYSHMKTLVISKEVAEKGALDFLDFLERTREIRDDFNFIVAKEGKAADVLKVLYTIQKSSALKLKVQLETAAELWGGDPDVRLNDFLRAMMSPGRHPVLAQVKIKGNPEKGNSLDNITKPELDAIVVIDSMAVFHDDKLVGALSLEETRNYLWTQDKLQKTIISIPCEEGDKDDFFAIRVKNSNTKLKGHLDDEKPNIDMNIHVESYVNTSQCSKPLDKKETYQDFQKTAEEYLQKQISGTIEKVQKKYGIDIFGFGEVISRQDYKNFKEIQNHWDEAFKEAQINVSVDVNISRAGLNTKGAYREAKEEQ